MIDLVIVGGGLAGTEAALELALPQPTAHGSTACAIF